MSFSRFFSRHITQVVHSAVCAFIFQAVKAAPFKSESPEDNLSDAHKQLIFNAFQQQDERLSEDAIHIVDVPKSQCILACVSGIPFFGRYELKISTAAIKSIASRSQNGLTEEAALSAITAHEAIHAKENHEFFIMMASSYLSLLVLYNMRNVTQSSAILFAVSSSLFTLSHRALCRQMEYRADKMAIMHHPELKESLKETLNVLRSKDDARHPSLYLLDDHPYINERIANIR